MNIAFRARLLDVLDFIRLVGKSNCVSLILLPIVFSFSGAVSANPGDLDLTFGSGGVVSTSVPTYQIEQDRYGRIVVAGHASFVAARFNSDGSTDLSFGNNGRTAPVSIGDASEAFDLAVQPDGKVILVGWVRTNSVGGFVLVRFDSNGVLDSSFGNGGIVTTEFGLMGAAAHAVKVQSDGRIVVAGVALNEPNTDYHYAVARYNQNGSLDHNFGRGGKTTIGGVNDDFAFSLALQTDGKIVVGGYSYLGFGGDDFSLARLTANGEADETFGNGGMVITDIGTAYDRAYSILAQADGKIVLGGDCWTGAKYEVCLARYSQNGNLDPSFDTDGKIISSITSGSSTAHSVFAQTNGKILVCGSGYNGTLTRMVIVRYNNDGSFDQTFGSGGIAMSPFNLTTHSRSAALQSDGKILLAGSNFNPHDQNSGFILRYIGDPVTPQVATTKFDFDGDGKADISVYRPEQGVWYWLNSSTGLFSPVHFGIATDKITPSDFDGDGKTDTAIYRDGLWYVLRSSDFAVSISHFGLSGDIPVTADYDGDHKADFAVFRQGIWYILNTSNGVFRSEAFGLPDDRPVVGDFDGDGISDLNVYRNGIWYVRGSVAGIYGYHFGLSSDEPVASDYDGDGKTDFAVYRAGQWYLQMSTQGFGAFYFGIATDQPVPADYDGDGKSDPAVYRDGIWYVLKTTGGVDIVSFGLSTDKPVPSAFLP